MSQSIALRCDRRLPTIASATTIAFSPASLLSAPRRFVFDLPSSFSLAHGSPHLWTFILYLPTSLSHARTLDPPPLPRDGLVPPRQLSSPWWRYTWVPPPCSSVLLFLPPAPAFRGSCGARVWIRGWSPRLDPPGEGGRGGEGRGGGPADTDGRHRHGVERRWYCRQRAQAPMTI
jgi:hypothetical protein